MKKCLNCGMENSDDSIFCAGCGTRLPAAPEPEAAQEQNVAVPEPEATQKQNVVAQEPAQSESNPTENVTNNAANNVVNDPGNYAGYNVPNNMPNNMPNNTQNSMVNNTPAPAKKKGLNKKIFIPIAAVLAVVLIVGVVGVVRINGFKNYVAAFEKACNGYLSLGKYESEYEQDMDDAKSIISGFKFWETGNQREKMQQLSDEISALNAKVAKYQKAYEEATAKMEKDSKYFLGDYEDKYNEAKADCESALKDFDEHESRKETEAFSKLVDEIIDYNKTEGDNMLSYVEDGADDVYSCEEFLLGQSAEKVKSAYNAGNFKEEKQEYDNYQSLDNKFTTPGNILNYDQVDVSQDKQINLYVNSDNKDESWNKDSFVIYEKKDDSDEWVKCSISDVKQIEGNMSIDLVADISDSMSWQFGSMQDCLNQFTEATEDDTNLGLSTISSVYSRELTFTTDKNSVETAINNLECEGLTSLYQSLYSSVLYTATATGSRCVVAFTDGINVPYGSGYDYDEDDVINIAKTYQIPVYIIGIGDDVEDGVLRNIAESTGGFYHNIYDVSELYDIYEQIYEQQKSIYQINYSSELKNKDNRQVYVYGESNDGADVIRFQSAIDAEVLADAYGDGSEFSASDLAAFYTKKKYLSQYELENITSVQDVQTIINIYYAKNDYKFGNEEVLAQMKKLGVITKNGIKDMNGAVKKMKKNATLYKNLMALHNYRYELFYNIGYDAYYNSGCTDYSDFKTEVNQQVGESADSTRYKDIMKKIYKRLQNEY